MRRILCFGDSHTWGTGPDGRRLPRSLRWTGVLGRALAGRAEVIEDGVPGRTTALSDPEIPGRNGLASLPGALRRAAPLHVVLFMLGTNDLHAWFQRSARQIADGMEALVRCALHSGMGPRGGSPEVLLMAPPPIDERRAGRWFRGRGQVARALAPAYEAVARRWGVAFLDVTELVAPGAGDGVHMDAEAHRRLGLAVRETLERQGWAG